MGRKSGGGSVSAKNPAPVAAWPADAVERRPLAALVPYARNARTHSEEQVEQLAAAITEWGWTVPVLVDDQSNIIAGHGRVLAAAKLGLVDVPVMVARGWSEAQKRAYVIADNKLALNAGWDNGLLALEFADIKGLGFDLAVTGFELGEIDEIFGKASANGGLTDPDDAPAPPVDPASALGDVWLLGRHRLACGDCTAAAVVEKAMGGVTPHLMVTDPPYGVEYDAAWRKRAGLSSAGAAVGKVLNDDRADWRDAWELFPGSVAYIWHAGTRAHSVAASIVSAGFGIRAQIIWVKPRLVLSRGDYHHQHEPLFYGVKDGVDEHWHFVPEHEVATYAVETGAVGQWAGGRKQSTVWHIEHVKSDTGHSTQKPVECMRRPIENNSKPGDAVYEPFSGSGTTIIAAEMTGRRCLAIELNPAYVDMAVERWQAFTGQTATLESTGETLEQVRARRQIEKAA